MGEDMAAAWAEMGYAVCIGLGISPVCQGFATKTTDGDDAEALCEACFAEMVRCAEKEEGSGKT
ncbi:MAG: hypothetical protein RBU21_05965 [FCB group bacterium]|jgi:hypothetical protein|nr:hypothetical protein [FCB group bacterium]